MRKRFVASAFALLAALVFSPLARTQTIDGWGRPIVPPTQGKKPGPAPRCDISEV